MSDQPKKWHEVYANDRECKIFKELVRGAKTFRSTGALAKAANCDEKEVEQFMAKYHRSGIVRPMSEKPGYWGYWQRIEEDKPTKKSKPIAEADQQRRIDTLQGNPISKASKPKAIAAP